MYAGVAVVTQSDAHLEWEETQVKMKNFYDLFVENSQDWNEHESENNYSLILSRLIVHTLKNNNIDTFYISPATEMLL